MGRYALWMLIVLTSLLSSAAYHLATDAGGRTLAVELNSRLGRSLAGEVRVQHVYALGVDEVLVTGLQIRGAAGEVLATATRIHIAVDATTLAGDIVFDDVSVEGLRVSMREVDDQLLIVEALRPTAGATESSTEQSVEVRHFAIRGAELTDLPEGLSVRALDAQGRLSGGPQAIIVVDSAGAEVLRDDVVLTSIDGVGGRLAASGRSELHARLRADESRVACRFLATLEDGELASYEGEVTFAIEEETLAAHWASDAALVLGSRIEGSVTGAGDRETFRGTARVETAGGSVDIDAQRTDDGLVIRGDSDGLDLARVLDGAELGVVSGTVTARLHPVAPVSGETRALEIVATDVRYDEHVLPEATFAATVGDDFVHIDRLDVPDWTGDDGELSLSGWVGYDRSADLSLSASLPGLTGDHNLQRAAPGLRGVVEANLDIEISGGSAPTIDASGRLLVRNAALGATRVARLSIGGSASGATRSPVIDLRIDGQGIASESLDVRRTHLSLTGGPEAYALAGRTQLTRGRSVDLSLDGVRDDGRLAVNGTATLAGVLSSPLSLSLRDLSIHDDGTVELRELLASGAGVDARAAGAYRSDGSSELEVELRSLDIGAAAEGHTARGLLRGSLHASGTIDRPEVELTASLADARFGLHRASEVTLSAGLSSADRSLRFEAAGELEGRGRIQANGRGRLARGSRLKRRVERAAWDADLRLEHVPLTLATLLSAEVPRWDGSVDATLSVDGVLPTPKAHLEATVTGFAAAGSDPIDADIRFDFETPAGDTIIRLRDGRGALATLLGRARFAPGGLRPPLDRRRLAQTATWDLSLSVPTRRLDRLPRPLDRDIALSAAVEGHIARAPGAAPTGEARVVLTRYDDGARRRGCRHGGLSTLAFDVDLGPRTRVTFGASTTGRTSIEGELSAQTPLGRWLADGFPDAAPPVTLAARARGLDLATIPGICDKAAGSIDVEVNATALLTPRPRGRVHVRATDLAIGDLEPFAASVQAHVQRGGFRAEAGVTSGPHRARLNVTGPLAFEGLAPVRPRSLQIERLVYRTDGGSAEVSGSATIADGSRGSVSLDGRIRRLPLSQRGRPAGRLTARVHIDGAYGRPRHSLTAQLSEATFVLPPAPHLSPAEQRRQREAQREAREAARRRPRPAIPNRAPGEQRTQLVLDATEPFWVRRDDMRLQLSARLLVDIVGGEPRARGRINVHGGRITAPAGAYVIDRGYIAFWGGNAEPEMYLHGSFRNRRGMRWGVSIFGPLGAPEVRIQ